MSDRRIAPDFDPDMIARLKARFAAKEPEADVRQTNKREERELKAKRYGDGRRRKRAKKAPAKPYVQLNLKVEPEFKDLVEMLADSRDASMTDIVKQAIYLLQEQEEQEKVRT